MQKLFSRFIYKYIRWSFVRKILQIVHENRYRPLAQAGVGKLRRQKNVIVIYYINCVHLGKLCLFLVGKTTIDTKEMHEYYKQKNYSFENCEVIVIFIIMLIIYLITSY